VYIPGKLRRGPSGSSLLCSVFTYDNWLACPAAAAASYLKRWTGELLAEPAPLMRMPRGKSLTMPSASDEPDAGELF